ncbi:hypothetical protein WME94_00350 [Sorangium sp. So ce429]
MSQDQPVSEERRAPRGRGQEISIIVLLVLLCETMCQRIASSGATRPIILFLADHWRRRLAARQLVARRCGC